MSLTDRIKIVIDVVADGANKSVASFRAAVNDADGATGKFRAGVGQLGGVLKAHAAEAAAAAATAIVAFGVKSVKVFQDLALETGKFGDATGIAYEDASRRVDIAGDLGLESSVLQSAVQRLNKSIGDGALDMERWGDQIVYANDGTVDSYHSFINMATAVGAIKDPTERAAEAQRVFGKSYGEIAELMEMDAESLRKKLEEVPKTNIFSDDQIDDARAFRQATEDLKGKLEELQLTVGSALVPVLTDAANAITALDDAIAALPLVDGIGDVAKYAQEFLMLGSGIDAVTGALDLFTGGSQRTEEAQEAANVLWADMRLKIDAVNTALGVAVTAAGEVGDASQKAAFKVRELDDAWSDLTGEISDRQSFLGLQDTFDDLQTKAEEAWIAVADGAENAEGVARDYEQAQLDAKNELIDYLAEVLKLPPERSTRILAAFDQGNLEWVEQQLTILSRNRTMNLSIEARGGTGNITVNGRGFGVGATGGIVTKPTMALIGEAGPEAVVPLNQMPGASPLPSSMGGGSTTIIQNFPAGSTPRDVTAAQRRYRRTQGPT